MNKNTESVIRQLKSINSISCDINKDVTKKEIEESILEHCRRSHEQCKELFGEDYYKLERDNKI